jgi:hypothetical protein
MPRRRLRPIEIREAESIFGPEIPYGRIWIHEHARWPNWIAGLGSALTGRRPPAGGNSITIGQSVYFPHPIRTEASHLESGIFGDMAWLLHELTHVWQYRQRGIRYLLEAAREQIRRGSGAYAYRGADGLREAAGRRASLSDFNPEQQGEIVRDYYLRVKMGLEVTAWEPFIAELRVS